MLTQPTAPPDAQPDGAIGGPSVLHTLLGRVTRFEVIVAAVVGAAMLTLVVIEPAILEAPFENERTLVFTLGGTLLAALGFVAMLWLRVPALLRVIVLLVPFVLVNWWLISPYFVDDVVDDDFTTSITEQLDASRDAIVVVAPDAAPEPDPASAPTEQVEGDEGAAQPNEQVVDVPTTDAPVEVAAPNGPVLVGAGQFVGLAGHSGTGDAGLFQNPDGSLVLRFENFDIENGPDLEVYIVPGADQTSLGDGSIGLGQLRGNVGDQNYDLPSGTELTPGSYTVLVWCEAFSVEFVGATITV